MSTLESLSATTLNITELAAAIEAAGSSERVALVRGIGRRDQIRIWEAAHGRNVDLSHLVPAGTAPGVEVIHAGKNSLPVFSHFEKRFCSVSGRDDILYGYNEGVTKGVVGPGCFVARMADELASACVDYYQVPPADAALPAGWPKVRPNEHGLSRFVYAKMVDHLRKISEHVCIGRAMRKGAFVDAWFLLCRQDPVG